MKLIFPIADTSYQSAVLTQGLVVTTLPYSFIRDLLDLDARRVIENWRGPTYVDYIIGVLPERYFQYVFPFPSFLTPVYGFGLSAIPGAVMAQAYPATVAHEIGHKLGLRLDKEENGDAVLDRDNIQGYNVNSGQDFSTSPKTCIMASVLNASDSWIHEEDYNAAFAALMASNGSQFQTIQGNVPSEESLESRGALSGVTTNRLAVSGILTEDGTFIPHRTLLAGREPLTSSRSGTHSLRLVDAKGQILYELGLQPDFSILLGLGGLIRTSGSPLSVVVPLPASGTTIQILLAGKVIATMPVGSRLLSDAINALPDSAFIGLAAARRNALLNMVQAIDKMIQTGAAKGARESLLNGLRPTVENWVLADYPMTAVVSLTRSEVIATIDQVIAGLVPADVTQ